MLTIALKRYIIENRAGSCAGIGVMVDLLCNIFRNCSEFRDVGVV